MKVTLLYGGLLAFWFIALSVRVILGRSGPGGPSLGDGGDPAMLRRIRGHANFAEFVPLALLLMALLELSGAAPWQLHVLGGALLVGRLLHGYALSFSANSPVGRTVGVALTLFTLIGAATLCLGKHLGLA